MIEFRIKLKTDKFYSFGLLLKVIDKKLEETLMTKRKFILVAIAFSILLFSGINSLAQVRKVQMHIGGYLCGN